MDTGNRDMLKVFVLLSTYNGEKFLEEQLESILRQREVEIELLIRDDGSTDRTLEIIERWEKKLKINFYIGPNVGPARSFMDLIKHVDENADYYAFCDQDDYWMPDKLLAALQHLHQYKEEEPILYYGKAKRVGANLEEIDSPFHKNYHTEKFSQVLVENAACGCTMVFNRCLLRKIKKYEPNYLQMHDSWILTVCAALDGKICYDPYSHILYRQHDNNKVGGLKKIKYGRYKLFEYRVKKFFDCNMERPSMVAKELINGYRDEMSEDNLKLTHYVADANMCIWSKLRVIINRDVRTPYWIINVKYYFQVIRGKS